MSGTRMGGILEPIRTLFGSGTLTGLTDGQLLERFRAEARAGGDPEAASAAFAALVGRHGPMVLGVCRSVLRDDHDAEDAFQATFLVLARRAGSIRRGDAVGSWLFGTARRVSWRARRREARRREVESHAARVESTTGGEAPGASGSLHPELCEEVARLPGRYRAAVVLCDLEGRTYEQAAAALGCPLGTLQSRLSRGRARLRARLTARGLAPAAVGVAAAGSEGMAGTLPLRFSLPRPSIALQEGTARAAVQLASGTSAAGVATGAALTLAGMESRRLLMIRLGTIGAGLLTTCLVAAGVGGLAIKPQDEPPGPPEAKAAPRADDDAEAVHVRVVDTEGRGVPGAVVHVLNMDEGTFSVVADAEGRIRLDRRHLDRQAALVSRSDDPLLNASPEVVTLGWGQFDPDGEEGTEDEPLTLTMLPLSRRVEGSVVDEGGGPIAGVRMAVYVLHDPEDNGAAFSYRSLLEAADWPFGQAVSDAEGRYTLTLPVGTSATMIVLHPRYTAPTIVCPADAATIDPVTLVPAGRIVGTVTDAGTGEPVPGAIVGAQMLEHSTKLLGGAWGDAITDAQGRFEIGSLGPGVHNVLLRGVSDRGERATARAVEAIRVSAGEDTQADLEVIEGRPLRGVAIDFVTDEPLAGISIGCYGPARPRSGAAVQYTRTDEEGRFTFYVPPGEQYVYLQESGSRSRLGHQTVIVPEEGEVEPVQLVGSLRPRREEAYFISGATSILEPVKPEPPPEAPEARTLSGRVLDADGEPIPGVSVYVDLSVRHADDPPGVSSSAATDREGVFVLEDLPRRELPIVLNRPGHGMQVETVAADEAEVEFVHETKPDAPSTPTPEPEASIPPDLRERLTFVDLEPHGNNLLVDGPGGNGNDLNRLPRGVRELGGAFFRIGKELIHLRGTNAPGLPGSIRGIQVGARADRLHFLHAAQESARPGTEVGAYVVHYDDGTEERIPLVYGVDISNWWWWFARDTPPLLDDTPSEARAAWTGANDTTDLNAGLALRLFALTWENPRPETTITAIDMISADTAADPFLVALTLERAE